LCHCLETALQKYDLFEVDSMSIRRPLIRYHGSKWRIAPWIISFFPPHRVYVELFGGGGAVLLRKGRVHEEIYNDLDNEIVNLFRVVRDNGEELKNRLALTPFAREEFSLSYQSSDDPVEQARRTVVRAFMGRATNAATSDLSTSGKLSTGFKSNTDRRGVTEAHVWQKYPDALDAIIARLRGVVIENRDAFEVIDQHDSEKTLFYADPPYVHSTRNARKEYHFEMSDEDHAALAEKLNGVKGAVIVSGYDSELYHDIYHGWEKRQRSNFADGMLPRMETLWMKGVEPDLFNSVEEDL
jgi:DNA adenine methylase